MRDYSELSIETHVVLNRRTQMNLRWLPRSILPRSHPLERIVQIYSVRVVQFRTPNAGGSFRVRNGAFRLHRHRVVERHSLRLDETPSHRVETPCCEKPSGIGRHVYSCPDFVVHTRSLEDVDEMTCSTERDCGSEACDASSHYENLQHGDVSDEKTLWEIRRQVYSYAEVFEYVDNSAEAGIGRS